MKKKENTFNNRIDVKIIDEQVLPYDTLEGECLLTKNKHRLAGAPETHHFNPQHSCFEICDNRRCQLSQQCIKIVSETNEISTPSIQMPTFDKASLNECELTENSHKTQVPAFIKYFKHSVISSLLLHAVVAGCILLVVSLLNPLFTNDNNDDMVIMDIVMIDTQTMGVLPENKVSLSKAIYQSIESKPTKEQKPDLPIKEPSEVIDFVSAIPLNDMKPVPIEHNSNHQIPKKNQPIQTHQPLKKDENTLALSTKKTIESTSQNPIENAPSKNNSTKLSHSTNKTADMAKQASNTIAKPISQNEPKKPSSDKKTQQTQPKLVNKTVTNTDIKTKPETRTETKTNNKNLTIQHNKSVSDNKKSNPSQKNKPTHSKGQYTDTPLNGPASDASVNPNMRQTSLTNSSVASNSKANDKSNHAKPIKRSHPAYPSRAANLGITGKVVVRFDINASGKLENIQIIESSHPKEFDKEVKRALKSWVYEKKPTQGIEITFNFQLNSVSFN